MNIGDVYFVSYPFDDDESKCKVRPVVVCLIAKDEYGGFYGTKLTSSDRSKKEFCYKLKDWKSAGLDKPTYALCDQFNSFNSTDIIKTSFEDGRMGKLSERDLSSLWVILNKALELYKAIKSQQNCEDSILVDDEELER